MDKPRSGSQPRIHLTEARNARGWSQVEVAESIGTTYVNVSRWERGITRPAPYFRKKLCGLFGKTEQELDLAQDGEARVSDASGHAVGGGGTATVARAATFTAGQWGVGGGAVVAVTSSALAESPVVGLRA